MIPSRLTKSLARRLTIFWRQQPTQTDIDELDANVERVGMVVRVRWILVAGLVVFSIVAGSIYALDHRFVRVFQHMLVPGMALGGVLVYNAYCQLNYRRLANITIFNMAQLLLDIVVTTVIVYYSGGAASWFASMYLLFVLEAALILPSARQVYGIALAAAVSYAALLGATQLGILPRTSGLILATETVLPPSYKVVRALWQFTLLLGAAGVANVLMRGIKLREERLTAQSDRDPRTGMFNRAHFRRELSREIERARRDQRGVSIILADIDGFERFNQLFGVDAGNSMIVRIADAIAQALPSAAPADSQLIVAARYGGEEFALIVPEAETGELRSGMALAESVRLAISTIRDQDRSVTVSIGVSAYPSDGRTATELIASADLTLAAAKEAGGNVVLSRRAGDGAVA